MNDVIFQPRDVPWALWHLIRKVSFRAIPIPVYFKVAAILSGLSSARERLPHHILRDIEFAYGGDLESGEVRRIGADFVRFDKTIYLSRILPLHPGFFRHHWPVEGLQYLDRALDKGRGVILATAHLGYPRMIPWILASHRYEVIKLVAGFKSMRKGKQKTLASLAKGSRFRRYVYERTSALPDPWDDQSLERLHRPDDIEAGLDVRPIFKALSERRILLVAADGRRSAQFINLPLVKRSYAFPVGFMKIALMTGSPILPAFAVPDSKSGMRVVIQSALPVDPEASPEQNLMRFSEVLDEQVRRAPHLWFLWGDSRMV